jgi:hypothetical protein
MQRHSVRTRERNQFTTHTIPLQLHRSNFICPYRSYHSSKCSHISQPHPKNSTSHKSCRHRQRQQTRLNIPEHNWHVDVGKIYVRHTVDNYQHHRKHNDTHGRLFEHGRHKRRWLSGYCAGSVYNQRVVGFPQHTRGVHKADHTAATRCRECDRHRSW